MSSERFLTAAAVADRLGVTPATIHDWVQRGRLPAVRLGGSKGGRLRIREEDLTALLEGWNTAPTAPRRLEVV